jgi:hypothetical protein
MTDEKKPDTWTSAEAKADQEWEDLQEHWKALRPQSSIVLVSGRASDMRSHMEMAAAKAIAKLTKYTNDKHKNAPITGEVLADITVKGVSLFMEEWNNSLKSQNLAGLIELVLEAQDLSPAEMRGFLQALPISLIDRMLKSSIGTVPGVHALVALEKHMRTRLIRDYTLSKEGLRIKVDFIDPVRNLPLSFYLDEAFQGFDKDEAGNPATR